MAVYAPFDAEGARILCEDRLHEEVRAMVRAFAREHPEWDAKQVDRAVRAVVTDSLRESHADGNRPRHLWAAWGRTGS